MSSTLCSISSAPAASGVTCPATSPPKAPSGATSTPGAKTELWTGSTTRCARKVRAAEKPYHPRTTASVDSQSVDTTCGGEARGRDNAKNVNGRKRHIVVDSLGLLLAVLVTAASVDDATAAQSLFARLDGQPMSKVVRMYADSKYHNFKLYEWVDANADWELSIVRRPEGSEGWVRLPIRWTVERTFAWLGRCRRLIKDHEKSTLSSESYIKLAMIQLMTHRLRPSETEPEFHYRSVA